MLLCKSLSLDPEQGSTFGIWPIRDKSADIHGSRHYERNAAIVPHHSLLLYEWQWSGIRLCLGGCGGLLHGLGETHDTDVANFNWVNKTPTHKLIVNCISMHKCKYACVFFYPVVLTITNVHIGPAKPLLVEVGIVQTCSILWTSQDISPEGHRRPRGHSGAGGGWQRRLRPKQQAPPHSEKGNFFILLFCHLKPTLIALNYSLFNILTYRVLHSLEYTLPDLQYV